MSLPLPPVHVIYENPDWLPPLLEGLEAQGFEVHLYELDQGILDPSAVPPEGIWINRISPSSHTRGHHGSVELARELLHWLEAHGRRVINGSAAYELEMSKFRQDLALRRFGIQTPRTVLAIGRQAIVRAAQSFDGPFITKHNQGGKGLGIQLFSDAEQLARYLDQDGFDPGPGGKVILQQYIKAPEPFITRVEIIGDRFVYAMRSDTSQGFELCPSDACQLPSSAPEVCPASGPTSKFSPSPVTAQDPLVKRYIALMRAEGIEIAGIEFIEDEHGNRFTYDITGTTNYSGVFADVVGIDGMHLFAEWIRTSVVPEVDRHPARQAAPALSHVA
jgi:hypothetical protein